VKKLFVILLLPVVCCGCFPATQLEERAIVQAVAVDFANDEYTLTLQVFDPSSGGENAGGSQDYVLLQGSGNTLTQAFESAAQKGKEIYLGSCRTLLVGGNSLHLLKGILDYCNSRPQTRATMLVTCTGGSAAQLLKNDKIKPSPAAAVEEQLMLAQKEKRLPHCRMMDILAALEDPTRHAVLPLLEQGEENAPEPALNGALLFREGTVDLALNPQQLSALNWLERGRGNLLLELPPSSSRQEKTALLLEAFSPTIRVTLENKVPQINLRLKVKGRISEYGQNSPDRVEQDQLKQLQNAAAQQMADQLGGLMTQLCQNSCDPLRLGERLKRSHPQQWTNARQNWPGLLKQAEWNIWVECRLTTYSGK